ncbi:hypothetical protein MED01_002333 [Micromonospora sp. MED01]|uniref:hypothetical protein n=1 Tax=Micromonospora alfalfae TaxID=2911212 RepID=UPI001EE8DFFA|nr:hypothetical protein [Micromonospora alfalfae]MCG5464168.1 hypothetical protein [Micromonospora alfalfae]
MTVTLADPNPMPQVPPLPMPPWKPGGPSPVDGQATCPTCGAPVASLLAACLATPACLTNDLDYDAAIDARCDQ